MSLVAMTTTTICQSTLDPSTRDARTRRHHLCINSSSSSRTPVPDSRLPAKHRLKSEQRCRCQPTTALSQSREDFAFLPQDADLRNKYNSNKRNQKNRWKHADLGANRPHLNLLLLLLRRNCRHRRRQQQQHHWKEKRKRCTGKTCTG